MPASSNCNDVFAHGGLADLLESAWLGTSSPIIPRGGPDTTGGRAHYLYSPADLHTHTHSTPAYTHSGQQRRNPATQHHNNHNHSAEAGSCSQIFGLKPCSNTSTDDEVEYEYEEYDDMGAGSAPTMGGGGGGGSDSSLFESAFEAAEAERQEVYYFQRSRERGGSRRRSSLENAASRWGLPLDVMAEIRTTVAAAQSHSSQGVELGREHTQTADA